MPDRRLVLAIAAVIALPLLFAALGGGRSAGLVLGIALVVAGLVYGAAGGRRARDGEGDG